MTMLEKFNPGDGLAGLLIILSGLFFPVFQTDATAQDIDHWSIGLIADCQYCNDPGSGARKYALSEHKLQQCVQHFNSLPLEYVIHLGDFIDRNFESFAVVKPIYNTLKMPAYHVLGNHDFSVADSLKSQIPQVLGLPSRYYDFTVKGWRFIVLDGNDVSFHAYPDSSEAYQGAVEYYKSHELTAPQWNGAVGAQQITWLRDQLENAVTRKESVVLYCHFPVYPDNMHNLWNANEIVDLLTQYSCVVAYINGHNHEGNYAVKDGVHYLTLKGMVDTEDTSYATMQVYEDRLEIKGFGREQDRVLLLRKP